MPLSPDEIERRTFDLAASGYDRDQVESFLVEVAATLRLAQHTTYTPAIADPAAARVSPDPFNKAAVEIAELLRSAHQAVEALHARAEAEIAVEREDAEEEAKEIRRKADADAAWLQDRAKRVLTTAQDQADAIVAEAEAQARAIIATAHEQAEERAHLATQRIEQHAHDVLRAERLALSRLHQAQTDVGRAIELIAGSDHPSIDVRNAASDLRFGVPIDAAGNRAPAAGDDRRDDDREAGDDAFDLDASVRELAERDPVLQMVRHAVGRAVGAARDTEDGADLQPPPGDEHPAARDSIDDAADESPAGAATDGVSDDMLTAK